MLKGDKLEKTLHTNPTSCDTCTSVEELFKRCVCKSILQQDCLVLVNWCAKCALHCGLQQINPVLYVERALCSCYTKKCSELNPIVVKKRIGRTQMSNRDYNYYRTFNFQIAMLQCCVIY